LKINLEGFQKCPNIAPVMIICDSFECIIDNICSPQYEEEAVTMGIVRTAIIEGSKNETPRSVTTDFAPWGFDLSLL
jgi:hypothetical protein